MPKQELDVYKRIGTNIIFLRAYKRMTQKELAECVGLSRNTISKIEDGKGGRSAGSLDTLEKIANKGFGINLSGLIDINLNQAIEEALSKYSIE